MSDELTFSRLIFGEQNGQLGENSHVSTLKTQASLEKADNFLEVSPAFVHLDEGCEFLLFHELLGITSFDQDTITHGMDDNVETADLSQTEFSLLNTSCVDLFPDPNSLSERGRKKKFSNSLGVTRLPSTFYSCLISAKVNEGSCQTSPIRNAREQ